MTGEAPNPDLGAGPPTWDQVRWSRWGVRGFALLGLVMMVILAKGEPAAYWWGIGCFVIAVLVTSWLVRRGVFKLTGRPQRPVAIFPIVGLSLLVINAPAVIQCAFIGAAAGSLTRIGFLKRSTLGV